MIYQLCVEPGTQRKLVGAALVREAFARSAYGCKLYCCWCAQDLEANYFWESMGFIPIAFRAGSSGKRRVHIFWQRRIVEGDATTPFWFPAQTNSGAIREDRLVFPIPPGTHWKDAMPVILPREENLKLKAPSSKQIANRKLRIANKSSTTLGRLWFVQPKVVVEKPKKAPREKLKNDPRHVAAARELRDRYLEQFNSGLVLPHGKYAVGRMIAAPAVQALPAAA